MYTVSLIKDNGQLNKSSSINVNPYNCLFQSAFQFRMLLCLCKKKNCKWKQLTKHF